MSKSDRDQLRYDYKHHGKVCTRWTRCDGWSFRCIEGYCICDTWWDYHCYEYPPPSWWNKECRREERAHAQNLMARARTGHIDWDDLAINYRRPWYW